MQPWIPQKDGHFSQLWVTSAFYSPSLMISSHNLHWPLVCFALGLQSNHHGPRAGLAFHYHNYLPLCWNEAITALLLWTTDMCQYKETQVSLHSLHGPWLPGDSFHWDPMVTVTPFLTHPLSMKVPGATSKVCMLMKERVHILKAFYVVSKLTFIPGLVIIYGHVVSHPIHVTVIIFPSLLFFLFQ